MPEISEVIQYLLANNRGLAPAATFGQTERKIENMGYSQGAYEREVIIRFSDADSEASLYTANPVWIRKFDKLVAENPEDFREVKKETYQGKVIAKDYTFPKRFLTVRSKDIKQNLTDEQRKAMSDRMKAMRAKHKTDFKG